MKERYLRLLVLPAVLYATLPAKPLNGDEEGFDYRGEIQSESELVPEHYAVELYDMQHHEFIDHAETGADGRFHFRSVHAGDYLVRVTDARGNMVHEEFAAVSAQSGPLVIRLPRRTVARPPSGPVSVTQLRHPPSGKAIAAVLAADKLSAAGQYEKAAAELEKAIRISPEFAEAYTNLAAQHIRMQRYEEALDEISRAMALSQPDAVNLTNRAYAEIMLGRLDAARRDVEAALQLAPDSANAHWVLGVVLAGNPRTAGEGLVHMEQAAKTIPAARAYLDRIQQAAAH